MPRFEASTKGLRAVARRRGIEWVIYELLQNAWDQEVSQVTVKLAPVPGVPKAEIIVEDDDPAGFASLHHAWTLFGGSTKTKDPTKGGVFDLGEKLVVACCDEAQIVTTTGGVRFEGDERHSLRKRTERGSIFSGIIPVTREEFSSLEAAVRKVLPRRAEVRTVFNGQEIAYRKPIATIEATLPTIIGDDEGQLHRTQRKTRITLHELRPGEQAHLYELGLPIVALEGGDCYHINVQQRVPLNTERDNVPAAFLRMVRALALNAVADRLSAAQMKAPWVTDALLPGTTTKEAAQTVADKRFGENAVRYDPSDPEAVCISTSQGRPIIHGGSLPADAWTCLNDAGALPRAGLVTPSRPEGVAPTHLLTNNEISSGMRQIEKLARRLAKELLDVSGLGVVFLSAPKADTAADFYRDPVRPTLRFNVGRLSKGWFEHGATDDVLELLFHEFGHQGGHHLETGYHEVLCRIAQKFGRLMARKPDFLNCLDD